jgi:hypothetical protein
VTTAIRPSASEAGWIKDLRFSRKLQGGYFGRENLKVPTHLILLGKFHFTCVRDRKGFLQNSAR